MTHPSDGPPAAGPRPPAGPAVYGPPARYGPPAYAYRPVPPPLPAAPDGRPLADFTQRVLAAMIDAALFYAVFMVTYLPAFAVIFVREIAVARPDVFFGRLLLVPMTAALVTLVVYFVYYVEMMHRTGQTIGKRAMKIRAAPIEPGARLTRGMATKRYLVEFIGGTIVPFFAFVDGLWQLHDEPYRQSLHDKFAKTVVVKVSP